MKTNLSALQGFLLILLTALLFSCKKDNMADSGQIKRGKETYYWYNNKKIPLYYDNTVWSVKVNGNTEPKKADFPSFENKITQIGSLGNGFFRVDFTEPVDLRSVSGSILFAIPSVVKTKYEESTRVLLTGNLSLSLKENADLEAITSKYELTIIEKGAYSVLLQSKNPINVIETANTIYEKEDVTWCEPEFFGKFTTF
ncbi:hypothetical protein A8C56_15925 [Niabella ginsenosidivorans]|uniref:Uncharacterized protein n=1 Tax=Niabella ginsenosidivorans TaxID=1176587 RepID=A0A1A9I6H2_9BACT|nr:hypothetical protein [Niabella ginsenosidivorans]ANH82252.1 hypothetical protein A8C56_15925 [Niabella ginsenosidivorans]